MNSLILLNLLKVSNRHHAGRHTGNDAGSRLKHRDISDAGLRRSKQFRQILPAIDDGDQFDSILSIVVFIEQKVVAYSQHAETGPDIVAERTQARKITQQLQLVIDFQQQPVCGRGAFRRDIAPDLAQFRLGAARQK
jgi:hypothetical protein